MISHEEIRALANQLGLRDDVVEKDYVIGWTLWAIGQDPDLKNAWIFKGGTSLKKCYIETYRFSEDLDFTVMPGGIIKQPELLPVLNRVLTRINEESGINFSLQAPLIKAHDQYLSTECRIYYQGPRGTPRPGSIKLDLNGEEKVVRPTVLRKISHPSYSDALPEPSQVRSYSFEELFAEKIRAMGERGRPRDLYDIINLFRRNDLRTHPNLIREVLSEKCKSKGIPVTSFEAIKNSGHLVELEAEWSNMLAHQLPALPSFKDFWDELPGLFAWLEETAEPVRLATMPLRDGAVSEWTPPLVTWSYTSGFSLEPLRFAAINHLCVDLTYEDADGNIGKRLIEPYSLGETSEGNILLHAIKHDTREQRTYRVDRMRHITVTNKAFIPKFEIAFPATGSINVEIVRRPRTESSPRRSSTPSYRNPFGRTPVYIITCPVCGKEFKRSSQFDTGLDTHKGRNGFNCYGSLGHFIRTTYSK